MPVLDTWVVGPADRQAGPAAVPGGPPVVLASFFSFSQRRWRVAVAGRDATGLFSSFFDNNATGLWSRGARARGVDSDPRRRWTGRGGPEAQGRPRGARVSVTDGRWTRRVQRDRPRHRLRARARWSAAGHDSDSRGGGARLARTRTHSRFSTRQPTCVRPQASATATTRPAPTMLMVHVALLSFCSVSRQAQLSCTIRVQMQRCTSF
jgi:hypothetical protein